MCDDLLAGFLAAAVRARANVIVAGGTGTGKTTMLRCLLNEIDAEERLITVEDSLRSAGTLSTTCTPTTRPSRC